MYILGIHFRLCHQVSVGGIIMLRDGSDGTSPEDLIEPIKGERDVLLETCTS